LGTQEARNAGGGGAQRTALLQPGSTVATALSEGEAQRKHCFVLEVRGTHYRLVSAGLGYDAQQPTSTIAHAIAEAQG
jgi:hypothetical protein